MIIIEYVFTQKGRPDPLNDTSVSFPWVDNGSDSFSLDTGLPDILLCYMSVLQDDEYIPAGLNSRKMCRGGRWGLVEVAWLGSYTCAGRRRSVVSVIRVGVGWEERMNEKGK